MSNPLNIQQHGPPNDFILQNYIWIILLAIIIPLLVIIVYRLFLPDLKKVRVTDNIEEEAKKRQENMKTDKTVNVDEPFEKEEVVDTERKKSFEVALQLLESDERKVVKALVEAGGSMLQKNISKETNMSRVKTHRVLTRLIRRNVVSTEKYYNTNKITLSSWLLEGIEKQEGIRPE